MHCFFSLVFPGVPDNVSIEPVMRGKELIPGQIIKDLKLEVRRLLFSFLILSENMDILL